MTVKDIIEELSYYIKNSQLDRNEKEVNDKIVAFQNDASILMSKLLTPMNVVVMGEVKAGKSTLINALVGREVSPTGVLETTAAIIDISYSQTDFAEIIHQGSTICQGTIEKVGKTLFEHREDTSFFEGETIVNIGLPCSSLKEFHIVDTPGLATITQANAEKTKNFIQNSDVVLWVFNANNLGQSDVEQELANVAHLGKPIIGIINRIDEVDSAPERLVTYLKRSIGHYLNEVLAVSSIKAFRAASTNNQADLNSSGFEALLNYMRNEIEVNADKTHILSILSTAKAILKHTIVFHESYKRSMDFKIKQIDKNDTDLERTSRNITQKVESCILNELDSRLFEPERQKVIQLMQSGVSPSDAKIEMLFSTQTLELWWRGTEQKASTIFKDEWLRYSADMVQSLNKEFGEFIQQDNILVNRELSDVPDNETIVMTGAGQGAAIAGAGAFGLAAYAAWLGPYSAYITLGSALAAYALPFVLVGGLIGLANSFFKSKKANKQYYFELLSKLDKSKQDFREQFIKAQIFPEIEKKSDQIHMELNRQFASTLLGNWTREQFEKLNCDMEGYIGSGNAMIETIYAKEREYMG